MNHDLRVFYDLVCRTRAGLLDWMEGLPDGAAAARHPDFAFGSLVAIEAHVAQTYLKWVGTVGLGRPPATVSARDVAELRRAFEEVDATVAQALDSFTRLDEPFPWTQPTGEEVTVTRRWLLLHTITHEFHHKGQALALARVAGHPHPGHPDTDLVEPRA